MKLKPLLLLLAIVVSISTKAQPYINNAVVLENNGVNNRFEIGLEIGNLAMINNPYDYNEIKIEAIFINTAAQISDIKWAFYYQDFIFNPAQTPCSLTGTFQDNEFLIPDPNIPYPYRIRYAPPVAGTYTYRINLYYNGVLINQVNSELIQIDDSENPGFITTSHQGNGGSKYGHFYHTNGDSYFPTGSNMEYYGNGDFKYCKETWDDMLTAMNMLNSVEANFTRVLMIGDEWGDVFVGGNLSHRNGFVFNIEWNDSPGDNTRPGNYDNHQNIAFLFDQLLFDAESKGIYIQAAITGYRDFKPEQWDFNPYKYIVPSPADFLTDPTAIDLYKRKLTYMMSRWGYSTNIFAWEILTESDYGGHNILDVDNWVDIMNNHIKIFDPNHMTTASVAAEYFDHAVGALSNEIYVNKLDFLDHHTYKASQRYNVAQFRRKAGIKKSTYHQPAKPWMVGELGPHGPEIGAVMLLGAHDNSSENVSNIFHNNIWSSSFSGQAGTSTYWSNSIFIPNWPSYKHILPLRKLINEINFEDEYFTPIATRCEAPLDPGKIHMTQIEANFFNRSDVYGDGGHFLNCSYTDPNSQYDVDIELLQRPNTSQPVPDILESKAMIFGLRSDKSIFGWIHKLDNFWWKIPHQIEVGSNPNPDQAMLKQLGESNCSFASNPATPADCHNYDLADVDAIFKNVCNGEYYIDYYQTYPNRPVVPNGGRSDGGVIPSYTRRLFTGNNDLHVMLPTLSPLRQDESVAAPDYGYHIRQEVPENYTNIKIGEWEPWEQATENNIETFYWNGPFVTKIFFEGPGNFVHYYWYDALNAVWTYGPLGAFTPGPDEEVIGDIAVDHWDESKVFFVGADQRLRMYKFIGTQWLQSCVGGNCSSPSSEFASTECKVEAMDDVVFYRGQADDKMHMFYNTSGTWTHKLANPSASGSGELVAGEIAIPYDPHVTPGYVFFINQNNEIGMYERNGSASNAWTYSQISNPSYQASLKLAPGTKLAAGYVDGTLYVFYRGGNGMMQYYKRLGTFWIQGQLSQNTKHSVMNNSNIIFQDNVVYYYSDETDNQTINRYYWDGATWRHSFIGVCSGNMSPNSPSNVSNFRFTSDRNIVYIDDADNYVKMYWNQRNCEKCTTDYNVPHYKAGKNDDNQALEELIAENNQMKALNIDYSEFESEDNNYRLMIFPNPAKDVVNISFDNKTTKPTVLKIVGTLGAVVKTISLPTGTSRSSVSVGELPRGLYYIHLTEESGRPITSQKVTLY